MKIAFYSYPSAFQNPGGGEVQLLKTKEHLEKLGAEVTLFDQWSDKFDDYDVFHVFGSVKDCVGLMETAKNKNIKVALSSIFWSSFKRAMHEGGNFQKKAELFSRHLTKLLFPHLPSGRRKTMVLSDIIFPNSNMEKKQLVRLFGISSEKIKVVPNGIDSRFLRAKPDKFVEKFGLKDFALAVGRIEPRKNQLNLIKAFNSLQMKLVIIGNPVSDYISYYETCKKEAGNNIVFIDGMRHEEELFESAYAACNVFVAPGWFETPGLAALEAAAAGAALAVTRGGCTSEYFGGDVAYFDPSDVQQIRQAVQEAGQIDEARKKSLRDRIKENYLWENVATQTLRGYESMLKGDI
ncbi:MAG: glycosyltransferase family 4 protein [Candidatus Omnitrophota bacterium]